MYRRRIIGLLFCALSCAALGQKTGSAIKDAAIWEPPQLLISPLDPLPKSSVRKDMIVRLTLDDFPVVLEETELREVLTHFATETGYRGDAALSLRWVCFQGTSGNQRWVLWLMSGEIDGPAIGGFHWRLISKNANVDKRCLLLSKIEVSTQIGLGMSKRELLRRLGSPTKTYANKLLYVHQKEIVVRNEPSTEMNLLAVRLGDGMVRAIEVWKSTIS